MWVTCPAPEGIWGHDHLYKDVHLFNRKAQSLQASKIELLMGTLWPLDGLVEKCLVTQITIPARSPLLCQLFGKTKGSFHHCFFIPHIWELHHPFKGEVTTYSRGNVGICSTEMSRHFTATALGMRHANQCRPLSSPSPYSCSLHGHAVPALWADPSAVLFSGVSATTQSSTTF